MRRSGWLGLVALVVTGATQAAPIKVGEQVPHAVETAHPYGGLPGATPRRVWSETLHHPEATFIQPHFAKFELADGDHVLVRSPDGTQAWRYEGLGRGGYGLDPRGFWSSRILGDTAVVELYTRHAHGKFGFRIDHFTRGLTDLEIEEANPDNPFAICIADNSEWAKCYEQSEPQIYERARAVARLHLPGGSSCTGWLVGCEGHLMTNNHCIDTAFEADNTDYELMAEGATCATSCFSSSSCAGPITTSGVLIQTDGPLDYSLIKLPGNLSTTYGYLTLREEGALLDERIYIPQHPAGWGKRIAVFSDHPQDQTGFCEVFSLASPPCTGGPGDIGYYCDTQGGSSGSPVLAYSDHKVVALHHCANCPNRGLDIADVIASLGANVPACAVEQLAGTIDLDRDAYSCSDTIAITVTDDSIQGAGTQTVTLGSTTEPTPETVVLIEESAGIFSGSFQTADGAPAAEDGVLTLSHGDQITALYIDADNGSGGTNVPTEATALADCAGPAIAGVAAASITTGGATITWNTDEPSDSQVQYGTEPPGSSSASDAAIVTSHEVEIAGLQDCTGHVYAVASVDELGNSASDDNGGQFYSFTTLCAPPVPIPGGAGGTVPLTVERAGAGLVVHWDDQCAPHEVNMIHGPLDQVASYAIDGARCSISQPEVWDSIPAGSFWFLVVGENKTGLESSWGAASAGERGGLFASGQCGVLFKNTLSSCP